MASGVGKNGRFILTQVPPGTYRLCAWEDVEDANRYRQALVESRACEGIRIIVKGGSEQVTLKQIPATHGLR
jgi:hypothetical protein